MANRQLTIVSNNKVLILTILETSVRVNHNGIEKPVLEVEARQIIAANHRVVQETAVLEVYLLVKTKKKSPFKLVKIEGKINDEGKGDAAEWVDTLMQLAYNGIKRARKLKVLVNPNSGKGKSRLIFMKTVEPILRAANCTFDVTYTTHRGHACEIAKTLSFDYDAVVTLSGDGTIHEVINGLALHENPGKALTIPVAPIPTGSGNALSLNLLGFEDGFDVVAAVLNAIKGQPMKVDLFSVTQNDKRTLSFMSQAMGLIADLDTGTESLRWMGDTRFVLGFVKEVIPFKACPIKVSIKVAEDDKHAMVKALTDRENKNDKPVSELDQEGAPSSSLPPLKYTTDEEGWLAIDTPMVYLYAGQGPYVARDYMAFPVSLADDGLIDVVVQQASSRIELLKSVNGAPKGESFWLESQRYFKAHAYRVQASPSKRSFAIDGELFPFEDFQVEVHPGLGTFLSLYGRYAAKFQAGEKAKNESQKA